MSGAEAFDPISMIPDAFKTAILSLITSLPPEQRAAAVQNLLGGLLTTMSVEAIQAMEAEIRGQFDPAIPLIGDVLDQIEGCLALRAIGADTGASEGN